MSIQKIYIRFFLYIEEFLSYVVPKNKSLWVYYPRHFRSMGGNIKVVFDYVDLNYKGTIKQYILDDCFDGKSKEYNPYIIKRYSIRGMLLSLRANVIFLDTGNSFNKGRFKVAQLWHGTGYKNIHYSNKNATSKEIKKYKNIILVPATSIDDKIRKEKSFLTKNVYLTGSPRNDFFFQDNIAEIKKELKIKFKVENFDKIYCYAPTFRDTGEFMPFSESFLEKIQVLAKEQNFVLIIKAHPSASNFPFKKEYSNIIDASKLIKDVHSLLLISDLLITDYSGISSDYALLRRPIVFYTYDFEDYVAKNRDFYYDIKKILPGPFAYTEDELIKLLGDTSWFNQPLYQKEFNEYLKIFHFYEDNQSSKRVVNQILNLIK